MAKREANIIAKTLNAALSEIGYCRQKKTWYLTKPDTVLVVDLQKSQWANDYYINLGVAVRQLDPESIPKIHKCPISHRLEMLVQELERRQQGQSAPHEVPKGSFFQQLSDDPLASVVIPVGDPAFFATTGLHVPRIFKALDLDDHTFADSERQSIIHEAMINEGIPFLLAFESLEKIEMQLRARTFPTAFVWGSVYDLVGCPYPQ